MEPRPVQARPVQDRTGQSYSLQTRPVQREWDFSAQDASLLSVAGRFTTGILHGFTTINFNRSEPRNVAEGVAQSLGTWMGITGSFVPMFGQAGRAVGVGGRFLARGASRKAGLHAGRSATPATRMPRPTSVPIALGNAAIRGANAAARRLSTPAGRQWASQNRLTLDAIEGAGRIGVAMGSLGWQEGIQGMLTGAGFGVFFGGTDRLIGNTVRQMRPQLQRYVSATRDPNRTPAERARAMAITERTVGSISAGIISGMPSTIMGMPWEYQIYDYLFGAWLGAEPPYHRRAAHRFLDQVRSKGEETRIMDPTKRDQYKPYQDLMDQHKNPKVRQGIAEEVEAQADMRFGQMMDAFPRASYILAASLGRPSSEVMNEIRDSHFANETFRHIKDQAVREGMADDQATEHAMNETRRRYVQWKEGEDVSDIDFNLPDTAEPWTANKRGYKLFQAVEMPARADDASQVAIVTSVDTRGMPLEITAMDGTRLVVPDGRGGARRTTDTEIKNQRESLRHRFSAIDRDQFQIMAANEDSNTPIPLSVWNRFPEVRDRHFRIEARQGDDGEWYSSVNLGTRELARTGLQASEEAATHDGQRWVREFQISETATRSNHMNDASEIWKAIQDFDDINTLYEVASIKDISRQIIEAEGITGEVNTLATYRKLLQIIDSNMADTFTEGRNPWNNFVEQIKSIYPKFGKQITDNPDQLVHTRQWFKRRMHEKPKWKAAYRDGRIHELGEHYFDGKLARETKAPSFIDRTLNVILGSEQPGVLHIDRVEGIDNQPFSRSLIDADLTEADFFRMTWQLATDSPADRPYYIMGGVKDKDTLRGLPILFRNRSEVRSFLNPRLKAMGSRFRKGYEKEKAAFVKGVREHIGSQQGQRAGDLFDSIYASEIRLWETMNANRTGNQRYPIKYLGRKGANFLQTRSQRNKRMQIMDAEGMVADREFYRNVKGAEGGRFKALLVNTINTDGTNHADGVTEYRLPANEIANQHRDGVVLVRPDVYDAMIADSGGDPSGSALKGFTSFSAKEGMFLGKYAMFRASEQEASFMDSQGTHLLYYTDSVKQQGARTSYNMTVRPDGQTTLWSQKGRKPVKPELYDVPVEGITFTLGKGDHPGKATSPQKLPVQLLQNLLPHLVHAETANAEINSVLNNATTSTESVIRLLSEVEGLAMTDLDPGVQQATLNRIRNEVKNIPVDAIGLTDINQILSGDDIYVQTGLFDRVLRHIMNEPLRAEDMTKETDPESYYQVAFHQYRTSAEVIFDAVGDGTITPALLWSRGFRPLFDRATAQYMTSRLTNPRMHYSMKSIGAGQSGWFMHKHKLKKGQFMLGQAAANMNIRAFGEDMTLGKGWQMFQADQTQLTQARTQLENLIRQKQDTTKAQQIVDDLSARIDQWNDVFTMVVSRVPIEHASGIRALQFTGFSDDAGTTSKLHPEDMANLGGMDLDIDDVFIFQNLGKQTHTGSDGIKRRLIDELKKPEVVDRWLDDQGRFIDQKKNTDFFDVKWDTDTNYATMFSPQANFGVSRNTAKGNKSLGIIANTKRDVTTYLSAMSGVREEYTTQQFMDLMNMKKAPDWLSGVEAVRIVPEAGTMPRIEDIGRTGINVAADAADLLSFKDPFTIMKDMFNEGTSMQVRRKGKWQTVTAEAGSSPIYRQMKRASQLMGGYNQQTGRQYSLSEIVYGLRQTDSQLRKLTRENTGREMGLSDIPGSFYKSAFRISRLNLNQRPVDNIEMQRLEQMYDIYNEIMGGKDVMGMLASRYTGGHAQARQRRRSVSKKGFVEAVKNYNRAIKNAGMDISKRQAAIDRFHDFLANDMANMVSVLSLYREGGRLVQTYQGQVLSDGSQFSEGRLAVIADEVTAFKWNFYNLMQVGQARTDQQRDKAQANLQPHRYHSTEALTSAIADYRASLPKELRRYFDFYGMSNLVTNSVQTRFLTNNPFYAYLSPDNARDWYTNYEKFWQMSQDKISQSEFSEIVSQGLDMNHLMYNSRSGDQVKPKPVSQHIENIKRLRQAEKSPETSEVSEAGQYNSYRTQREVMAQLEASRDFKFTDSEQQMVRDLQELFRRHPIIEKHFEQIFSGEQHWHLQRLARKPEAATMEDIRDFLGIMRGYRHGNLFEDTSKGLGPTVDRFMYWMMPNRYHEKIAKFDLQTVEVYGPVIDLSGKPQFERTRILTSTPEQLRQMSNTSQLAEQTMIRHANEEFARKHKPIEDGLGDDHELLWNYTAHWREHRSKDQWSSYSRRQAETLKARIDKELAGKKYKIGDKEMGVDDVIDHLDRFITEQDQWVWNNIIVGRDRSKYEIYRSKDILDTDRILTMIGNNLAQGDPALVDIYGTELLHRLSYQYSLERNLINRDFKKGTDQFDSELRTLMDNHPYEPITPVGHDSYYPHNIFDKATLRQIAQKRWKQLLKQGTSEYDARQIIADEMGHVETDSPSGEAGFNEMVNSILSVTDDVVSQRSIENIRSTELPGSLRHRTRVNAETGEGDQLPGWDPDVTALLRYSDQMISSQSRKALALAGAKQIDDFQVRLTQSDPIALSKNGRHAWSDFFRLYIRDQVGTTTEIPRSWYDSYPELRIRKSGYKYFTDTWYRRLDRSISKNFGIRPMLQENDPLRPFRLVSLSNAEAKYSLLTLLSRPKTMMTNLYGGTQLSAVDLGIEGYFRGWRLSELNKMDPTKKTWDDWIRFSEDHGAMESLIRNEVMASPAWRQKRNRKGLEMMMRHLKRDPSATDKSLFDIGRKYGLTDAVMDAAAFPMRYSERKLRTHAFLAHLAKAADVLEVTGPKPFEHPWVLEMARRGTVSSQFLYNNANRPAFARSNMGKIFTRFKLWAFNSVQFRTHAVQRAAEVGYRPGTEAYQKFERMVASDMFMLGLAMLFPFTLFATALPEPYGWLKDLVTWGFGDDQDKKTTFFGALPKEVAPLNMALPPSSRVLSTWFQPMLTGEWDQFTGYHLWSFFPFGLLTRDVKRAAEQPSLAIDRLTGIPVSRLGKEFASPFSSIEEIGTGIGLEELP